MKRSARIVALASVAWLGLSAWAIATDSRAGEVTALAAGMLLLASVWLLLRAADNERRRWQHTLDAMQAGIVLSDETAIGDEPLRAVAAAAELLRALAP